MNIIYKTYNGSYFEIAIFKFSGFHGSYWWKWWPSCGFLHIIL